LTARYVFFASWFRLPLLAHRMAQNTDDYVQRVEPSAQVPVSSPKPQPPPKLQPPKLQPPKPQRARFAVQLLFVTFFFQGGRKMAGLFVKLMQQHGVLGGNIAQNSA
jgi:hypothetical protein